MTDLKADWDAYASSTNSVIIQAYYYFSVWRSYFLLLRGLPISSGTMLEIGASTGQNSLRLSKKYQLQPTLVDTSPLALKLAQQRFALTDFSPILVNENVLSLSLPETYDVVHSHGLLEHFRDPEQTLAFNNHAKHVREGGWLICWVPTPDIPYRLNRWYLETTHQWIFGYERPLTVTEFARFFHQEQLHIRKIRHFPGWLGIAAQRPIS